MHIPIPSTVLAQHVAVLGKTGAGKSSALRLLVEYLLTNGKRVCVIDPKGDWWGLKSSADGKSAGFPVIALGEFKEPRASDVPINAHSGRHIAELIATGNRPAIIGFRGWMPGAMTRFWIDFASTLFNTNGGELYLVIDEVHNFAAKGKIMDPDAGKCLHWTNRIMAEGRGVGLVCMIASQRPQKVHNDTLTCCETLVAMRVNHPSDRAASADWIDGCGDPKHGASVLAGLASLPRGEAFVWSPEIGYGPERVRFPMFGTFDSFAPPQLQKKVNTSGWGDVDLGAVKEKLAAVIEEAKANDPAHLKAELGKLRVELGKFKTELDKKPTAGPAPARVEVKVPDRELLVRLMDRIDEVAASLNAIRDPLNAQLEKLERIRGDITFTAATINRELTSLSGRVGATLTPVSVPNRTDTGQAPRGHVAPRPVARDARPQTDSAGSLAKADRAILTAIAQRHPRPTSKSQAAILSGYSVTSSTFANALSSLRVAGYIEGTGDNIRITSAGMSVVGTINVPSSAAEVQTHWLSRLGKAERAILQLAIIAYPNAVSREEIAQESGYSVTSSTFANALSQLRVLELITRDRDVRATDNLFPS